MTRIIIPLDVGSAEEAHSLVDSIGDQVTDVKVGLELFSAAGPEVVQRFVEGGRNVFLDLKLHDIPNTVARAVTAAAGLGVELLTLHATGGPRMMEAARDAATRAAEDTGHRVRLLGVTVLTSAGAEEVEVTWGRSIHSVREEVLRLARLAVDSGLDGVVTSALEAAAVRRAIGPDALIVTPGIRFSGGDTHDQTRVTTPGEAASAGADYIVVGRAITAAEDPAAAYARCLAEITEVKA